MQEQLELVYEDAYCLIVNKPSDLLVHHSYYARNVDELSLTERIRLNGLEEASPVHRLDRKTSGLVLIAKRAEWVASFQQLFTENRITKKYKALLRGHVAPQGIIDSPVKNERGNYKDAETHFVCLQQFTRPYDIPPYESQRYSLVEFIPKTGRMHQLRIHANKIAHPIINDPKYGNRHHNHYFQQKLGISQLFLHADNLRFTHPYLDQEVDVSVPLPAFWDGFLSHV